MYKTEQFLNAVVEELSTICADLDNALHDLFHDVKYFGYLAAKESWFNTYHENINTQYKRILRLVMEFPSLCLTDFKDHLDKEKYDELMRALYRLYGNRMKSFNETDDLRNLFGSFSPDSWALIKLKKEGESV